MPLISDSHDSLPYIDVDPTPQARAAAKELISMELPPEHQSTLHPSIPALLEPRFSPLIQQELARKEAGLPLTGGVNLSRYEAPEPPTFTASEEERPLVLEQWRQTLRRAYASSSHLDTRHGNLSLLEESGKNAWLIGNSQLEDILRSVEKELAETKQAVEDVNKQRKIAQEVSKGELEGLEETWRRGIGATIDVEVAAESLQMQILDRRRQLAQHRVK